MWVTNGAPYTDSDKSKFTSYFVVPLQTCKAVHVMEVLTQIAFSYWTLELISPTLEISDQYWSKY